MWMNCSIIANNTCTCTLQKSFNLFYKCQIVHGNNSHHDGNWLHEYLNNYFRLFIKLNNFIILIRKLKLIDIL